MTAITGVHNIEGGDARDKNEAGFPEGARPHGYCLSLGSSASLRPSPTKLMLATVRKINMPG